MRCLEILKLGWLKNCHNCNLKPDLKVTRPPPSDDDDTLNHNRNSLSLLDYADQKKVSNPKRSCVAFSEVNDACTCISTVTWGSCFAQVITS